MTDTPGSRMHPEVRPAEAALLAAGDDPFAERQRPFAHDHSRLEASRCLYCYDAPCMIACPTSIDIPSFIRSIAVDDDLGAARTIMSANVLGASCGRVCETDALCEGACVLGPTEKPIEIGRLQRHATDLLISSGADIPYTAGPETGRSVGIVGGGPGGLAAAAILREAGHAVTIYERLPELGGLARYGIIPVREPNSVIEWEVAQIVALGVEVRTGVELGLDITAEALLGEHDAVVLATGAGATIQLIGLENETAPGVEDALDFIAQSRTRTPAEIHVGQHVVVVGGGNTAMDAATIAVQLQAPQVTCVYRRTAADMTAYPTEVDFCRREGVLFRSQTQPVRVLVDGAGQTIGLECANMVPGEPDESGRRRPVLGDERFTIDADHVLMATGQQRTPALFEQFRVDMHRDGRPVIDIDWQTSRARVYACGDASTTGAELSVVDAVAQGRDLAIGLAALLSITAVGEELARG